MPTRWGQRFNLPGCYLDPELFFQGLPYFVVGDIRWGLHTNSDRTFRLSANDPMVSLLPPVNEPCDALSRVSRTVPAELGKAEGYRILGEKALRRRARALDTIQPMSNPLLSRTSWHFRCSPPWWRSVSRPGPVKWPALLNYRPYNFVT
jgi:hypothetical protein